MEQNEFDSLATFLKLTGHVQAVLTDKHGRIKEKREIPNKVVNSGLNHIAARMLNAQTSSGVGVQMSHMAIGTGTTAPDAGDTTLGTPNGVRQSLTSFTTSANTMEFVATFATGYSGAITEAGVFNALTAGTMLCRSTFLEINKADDDTLTITWIVSLT